jgi:hypothetical protein
MVVVWWLYGGYMVILNVSSPGGRLRRLLPVRAGAEVVPEVLELRELRASNSARSAQRMQVC